MTLYVMSQTSGSIFVYLPVGRIFLPLLITPSHCKGQAKNNAWLTFSVKNNPYGCPESGEVCLNFRLKQI